MIIPKSPARLYPVFMLLLSCFFSGYAQNSANERKQLFDNDWSFFLGDRLTAASKKINEKNWRKLDLPHDWSIEGKIDPKNPTGKEGGYFPAGVAWYRKTFKVPEEWKGKNVSGEAAKIKLTVDRKEILANGQDLSYVTIELTDMNGIIQPNAANPLQFKIKGPGIIAGVDNADLKDTAQYVGNSHKAWKGRALVVIKSTHSTGDIKLTVSSPGLPEAVLNIKTVNR